VQVSSAAIAAHQQLYLDITIPTGGYLYTYVANESNVSASANVYFDDFNIIHTRNASTLQVAQTTDYYPFGLAIAAQSYQKQSSLDNDYLYNGKELQDEHNLGWMDYGARMFMPEIGRWGVVDMLGELGRRWSSYTYALDNPMRFIGPDGMWASSITVTDAMAGVSGMMNKSEKSNESEEPEHSQYSNDPKMASEKNTSIDYGEDDGKTGELWPTWTHNAIIEAALGDLLTPEQIQVLKDASLYTDRKETQDPKLSFIHAMRAPGQPEEDAKKLAFQFIQDKQNEFIKLIGR